MEQQIEQILAREIAWYESRPRSPQGVNFTRGFIAGLKQAQYLIKKWRAVTGAKK